MTACLLHRTGLNKDFCLESSEFQQQSAIVKICRFAVFSFGCIFLGTDSTWAVETPDGGFADLSLEQLGNIEVTSVSKKGERLADAAASIYVITNESIRQAGVTTLPEALRLAPNLQVARINSNQYAISARGFNSSSANKLLVMIDGRTIYTPLYSGVFWDAQDVLLEDVDRIEVISGPGGTLWGANAVNGVINIITKTAQATVGNLAYAAVGNTGKSLAARAGGSLGEGTDNGVPAR